MRFLAVRHIRREGAGSLEEFLRSRGHALDYWDIAREFSRPVAAEPYDAVIVLGGPMGVYEEERYPFIRMERDWLRGVIDSRKPVLGICLGAQLLASALGARVHPGTQKEIGWSSVRLTESGASDALLSRFPGRAGEDRTTVFQWHGDTFELPRGAVRLADSALYSNQAFRYDNYVYALQFHLEMTGEMIVEWVREGGEEMAECGVAPTAVLKATETHLGTMKKQANLFYEAFAALAARAGVGAR
ncbi:MAG: gamma-glutamyl-gamma-aminobutyrate hydrolase family protein [Candidatus Omnitrophica bacterium]|nr:gamma-glutamyl-gamma-aminobutyrate hydrolase family protein [Candidatus Omnitrophota bacterium]